MKKLNTRLVATRAKKVATAFRSEIGRRSLRRGVLLGSEHNVALQDIPISTLIDVGANRGQFALSVLAEHAGTVVISFEPLDGPADIFEGLVSELALNDLVTIHRVALGDRVEIAEMHISRSDDSSSLLSIGQEQIKNFPGTEELTTASVPVSTLDSCLATESMVGPVLLKLDVQGAELQVLAGATKVLPLIDHVYVEVSFREFYDGQPLAGEIVRYLDQHGFSLASIGDVAMDSAGAALQADLLFSRTGAASEGKPPLDLSISSKSRL